ncbi:MAG TPA: hypothetical protein ENJ00_08965 [Phycisphaerales bacterium]|nr:hypothetical protein [Phycisphaerales bacterium]
MKLREAMARANRLQQHRRFKIAASAVIVVVALIVMVGALVAAHTPDSGLQTSAQQDEAPADSELTISNADAAELMFSTVLSGARGPWGVVMAAGLVAGVALVIVWLGLGLTYLGLAVVVGLVAGPMWMFGSTRGLSKLIMALVALSASFTALMQGLRLLLSGNGPVRAIARNVLAEAVRLKLSIIFIVLLIFGLAALPGMLDAEQPLRYRVQSFLQYGTGGSFWIIALLVVFFSVSTVATEQRDKIIWQTMTKPVPAWKYIFGKWLGVSGLAAVLLAVSSSGVFLFVEYLRNQPALGEREAYVAMSSAGVSEDRLVLETQVLSARRNVPALEPELDEETINSIIADSVKQLQLSDPNFQVTPKMYDDMREELVKRGRMMYFSIQPGDTQTFVFDGIDLGPDEDVPVVLKYRVDAGSNRPDEQYKISIGLPGLAPVVRATGLGHSATIPIAPLIVLPPSPSEPAARIVLPDDGDFPLLLKLIRSGKIKGAEYIPVGQLVDEDGKFAITLYNGQFAYTVQDGRITGVTVIPNPSFMQIPQGGLYLSYTVGTYHANYIRAMTVLWLKLAFLAMLGIFCSTFLSFPVASMVTLGVFLMAESSGYLRVAIDNYHTLNDDNQIVYFKLAVSAITYSVSWIFRIYAELSPVERLVNGEVVGFTSLLKAVAMLGSWCALLFAAAVVIFRRRELAIYSGQ